MLVRCVKRDLDFLLADYLLETLRNGITKIQYAAVRIALQK